MSTYRDTAQHAAEAVSVSVAQGRSFIARCEDLDREMVKVDALAGQVCAPRPPTVLVRGGSAGCCGVVLSTYYRCSAPTIGSPAVSHLPLSALMRTHLRQRPAHKRQAPSP